MFVIKKHCMKLFGILKVISEYTDNLEAEVNHNNTYHFTTSLIFFFLHMWCSV